MTMMISAPLWGAVADRYGRKLMLIRATLGGAVLIALMGFVHSAEQLTLLRALQKFQRRLHVPRFNRALW